MFSKSFPNVYDTDGPEGTDGRAGRDGRTEYSFTVLLGQRNTVLQFYWHGEIQFYSSTGTEKYSFTVLLGRKNTVLQV